MKILSILLMLAGVFIIVAYGVIYLLGFAMSFDAPGSTKDPKAWMMRLLIFMPLVIFVVLLILAFIAFYYGHYKRSVMFSAFFGIAGIGFFLFSTISSVEVTRKMNQIRAQEVEDERLYPKQTFLRPVEGGVDTIYVFPSRIVSYRLYVGTEFPYGGPLGDLNTTRDTLIYNRRSDTKLNIEDLPQFVDEKGRKFSDVYIVK